MKKRILGILLTLCIVICLAPTGVFADGETVKNVATAQELIDALADGANGTVRLAADIDIAGSLNIFRTVTLDLNGHVLKMTGSGSVIILDDNSGTNTGDLTLVDSDPTAEHKFKVNGAEPWTPDDNGTEVVCGGIITGGTGTRIFNSNFAEGGGVNVGNGVFTMTGGNIVGCTAYYGGGDEKYLADKYLPFEITDSKDADACDRILSGIWYSDNGVRIADPGSSGLPDIENFLVRIMDNGLIRCVRIAFDPAHGYVPSEYPRFDIAANEFCKTLMSVPCHGAVPDGELNIRKTGG
ncbi:putative cell wall binding repeat 2 [Anaerotruncus sp. CAG:390]|nr:putative cell wall binding repeat 2 [Anaerotruncus sp. CAG:390]